MDIDVTILLQLGLFLALLAFLNGVLFKPVLAVFEARYQALEGARSDIARLKTETEASLSTYQSRIREAKDLAQKEREALLFAGRSEERQLLAKVRAEIAQSMNDTRKEVALAETAARQLLNREINDLAGTLVQRILGREVER